MDNQFSLRPHDFVTIKKYTLADKSVRRKLNGMRSSQVITLSTFTYDSNTS